MTNRWIWSAAVVAVASSSAGDAFVLGTSAASAGKAVAVDLATKTTTCSACRQRYPADSPVGFVMAGRPPSLDASRGAAATLLHRAAPSSTTTRGNRGSLVGSSGQRERLWRNAALFGRGEGWGRGAARDETAAEADQGVYFHEKAATTREYDHGRGGGNFSQSVAAAWRFLREGGVPRRLGKTSKLVRARIVGWRRGVSLAFLGMAAALFVMTVSAGPSSAFLESTRLNPDGTPRRLTEIPEEIYQRREALQEFCQSHPKDRLFDFDDLTTYEEELNKLDMFSDKIKVPYGTRESMRLKYSGYLADFRNGGKTRGLAGALRLGIFGTLVLLVVTACLNAVAWVFKSFLSMAKEEEVHLYGEEISVDATEKETDELQETDDEDDVDYGVDDDDLEDFAKSGSASTGMGSSSSPSSSIPSSRPGLEDGAAGDSGSVSEDAGGEEDDDLLGA